MDLTITELPPEHFAKVVDYFIEADPRFLLGMGAEKSLLPSRESWIAALQKEYDKPLRQKELFYVQWNYEGRPIGHSNINKIEFGAFANMHLHMWDASLRQNGLGRRFVELSITEYFEKFELQYLICEPYAANPAPNKTLPKLGFEFVRSYETVPGKICFPQMVNRYELPRVVWSKRVNGA